MKYFFYLGWPLLFGLSFLSAAGLPPIKKPSSSFVSFGENFYIDKHALSRKKKELYKLPAIHPPLRFTSSQPVEGHPLLSSQQRSKLRKKRNFSQYEKGQYVDQQDRYKPLPGLIAPLLPPLKKQKLAKDKGEEVAKKSLPKLKITILPLRVQLALTSPSLPALLYQCFISFLSKEERSSQAPTLDRAFSKAANFYELLEKKVWCRDKRLLLQVKKQQNYPDKDLFSNRLTYLFRDWTSLSFLRFFRKNMPVDSGKEAIGKSLYQLGKKELLIHCLVCSCFPDDLLITYLRKLSGTTYTDLFLLLLFLNRTCVLPQITERSMYILSPLAFEESMDACIASSPLKSSFPNYKILKELTLNTPVHSGNRMKIIIEILRRGWPFLLQNGSFPVAKKPFALEEQKALCSFLKQQWEKKIPLAALFRFSIYLQQLLFFCPLLAGDLKILRSIRKAKLFFIRKSMHARALTLESKKVATAWKDKKQSFIKDHQYKLEEGLSYLLRTTFIPYKLNEEVFSNTSFPSRYSYKVLLKENSYHFNFRYEAYLADLILKSTDLKDQLLKLQQGSSSKKIKDNLFFELLYFYNLNFFEALFFSRLNYKEGTFPCHLLKEVLLQLMNLWTRWFERHAAKASLTDQKLKLLKIGEKKKERFLIRLAKKILIDREGDLEMIEQLNAQSKVKPIQTNYPLLNLALLCKEKPLILSKLFATFAHFIHPISCKRKGKLLPAPISSATVLGQNKWVAQGSRLILMLIKHQLLHLFDTKNLLWQELEFSLGNYRSNRERYSKQLLHYFLWFCYHAKHVKEGYRFGLATASSLLNKYWLQDLRMIPAIEAIILDFLTPKKPFPVGEKERNQLLLAIAHCEKVIMNLYEREVNRYPIINKTLVQLKEGIQQNSYHNIILANIKESIEKWPIDRKPNPISIDFSVVL